MALVVLAAHVDHVAHAVLVALAVLAAHAVLVAHVALVDLVVPVDLVILVFQVAHMNHPNVVPVFRVHQHLGILIVVPVVHVVLKYLVVLAGHVAVTADHLVKNTINHEK